MADDLLNSMLGGSDDDDKGNALNDLLGQAASAPGAAKGAGADALGGLAGMLGGAGGGDLAGMLGALTGGGGSGLGGALGGLMGGSGGMDLSQMPVVGPIVASLAEKFGIPPAQATALVTSALAMLMSQKNRSGADRLDEIDIGAMAKEVPDQSDIIAKAAAEAGLDEKQTAAGVQEALQMLAAATQGE